MKAILIALLALTFLFACNSDNSPQTYSEPPIEKADSMAVAYYQMLVNGNFTNYVEAMQSCDNTTADYKQRIESMLRHHQQEIKRNKKGVQQVTALRHELHDNDCMANVFLRVTYKDGSEEEIIFPIVFDGERWRIQ